MIVTVKVPLRERLILRDHMLGVFRKYAAERPRRQEWVPDFTNPGREELGWVIYEREQMCAEVNKVRSARGLQPILIKDFARIERQAVGHSDYDTKLSLYCAELALGEITV